MTQAVVDVGQLGGQVVDLASGINGTILEGLGDASDGIVKGSCRFGSPSHQPVVVKVPMNDNGQASFMLQALVVRRKQNDGSAIQTNLEHPPE